MLDPLAHTPTKTTQRSMARRIRMKCQQCGNNFFTAYALVVNEQACCIKEVDQFMEQLPHVTVFLTRPIIWDDITACTFCEVLPSHLRVTRTDAVDQVVEWDWDKEPLRGN